MVNEKLRQRYGKGEARALYELIMERRFGLSRTDILLGKGTTLSAEDKEELQIILERVAKGEPVQYVLGSEVFCGREFCVGPGVLIPRPETAELVRLVEQHLVPGSTVLDIGTGSGCIAITLALDGYKLTAVDVSDDALSYARRNAQRLGADVQFVKADIMLSAAGNSSFFILHSSFNCIVSNPPYVCQSEASMMDDNVLLHEPALALFVPDDDPLCFYRAIADIGQHCLADGGLLFFETNRAFAKATGEMLRQKGYIDISIHKDQYENDRFVWARKQTNQ